MTTQEELIAALRGKYGDSQAAIAEAMEISLSRLNNYVRNKRSMDDDAVIACCELLGWNARKYVSKHRAEAARTAREAAFWKRLSSAAAIVAMLAAGTVAQPSHAAEVATTVMHYAKYLAGITRLAWSLLTAFFVQFSGDEHGPSTLLA